MGMLIDGQWSEQDLRRANAKGEFVRPQSPFRDFVFAEKGRYHLFVNAGCPWAYRTILYRQLKGLTDIIGMSLTQAAAGAQGWTFGATAEPVLQAEHIHDIYAMADPKFTGRATVPVLWDLQTKTIVNNESADIIRMFNSAFDNLDGVSQTNYYPAQHAAEIDRLNRLIYDNVNNGVYRCGFAQSQTAYETAFDNLFSTLDQLDERLATNRYLCGDDITEADWRFFATLVRFDPAYHGQFRCNRNLLSEFQYLWPYTRDLYQQPGVGTTVDISAIKDIYYGSRPPRIIPKGPRLNFNAPHNRGYLTNSLRNEVEELS